MLVAGENARAAADAAAKLAGVKKVLLADGALYAHDLAEPLAEADEKLAKMHAELAGVEANLAAKVHY